MSKIFEILNTNPVLIPAVVSFPIHEDSVLLMHRLKTSSGLGQDLISGIGGKVGDEPAFKNETHEEALIREMQEEVGIRPTEYKNVGQIRFLWETKPNWNMDVSVYLVSKWKGDPQTTEVAKPVWYKISGLPKEYMWEDNLHWVPKVLAGEEINAVFLYGENKTLVDHMFL